MHLKIVLAAVLFSAFFTSVRFYHDRYLFRTEEAKQASLYLKSDVCSNSKLRVQVSKYQDCSAAEMTLGISPSTRAIYDLLELYTFCGSNQKRCEALVFWFKENKFVIFAFLGFIFWVLYNWLLNEWQMQKINQYMNRQILPIT